MIYTSDDFLASGTTSGGLGGRYVFRYNTVYNPNDNLNYHLDPLDAHGNQAPVCGQDNLGQEDFTPGQRCTGWDMSRGTVTTEIYGNNFTSEAGFRFISLRGGTGVIYNNTMADEMPGSVMELGIHMWEEEQDRFAAWNSSFEDYGYPGYDQINNYYVWGNTFKGSQATVEIYSGGDSYYIQEDRDYFSRAQNRETDYWYGYEPFTYPHPLTQIGAAYHESDSNRNGCVELSEMVAFMDRWKISSSDVAMPELMETIGLWKSGTGC
jgi:hypothetical protein